MIVLPSIDEQRMLLRVHAKASFAETHREQLWKKILPLGNTVGMLVETKLTCLFKAVSLTMTVFADYAVFSLFFVP